MCYIEGTSKAKWKNGYKVVIYNTMDGRISSPATGLEYKKGKNRVPILSKPVGRTTYFYADILNPEHRAFEIALIGRTSVFDNLGSAKSFQDAIKHHTPPPNTSIQIVKMRVSGNLVEGEFRLAKMTAGKNYKVLGFVLD